MPDHSGVAQVDSFLRSVEIFSQYADPRTGDGKVLDTTPYISEEDWKRLFCLDSTGGRTILHLRNDMRELSKWLSKMRNDRMSPYVAAAVVDGLNPEDWTNLQASRKLRESTLKRLHGDVAFTTYWERMTEVIKEQPPFSSKEYKSANWDFIKFGQDAFQMVNNMRDGGFMAICERLHSKAMGLPATSKGVLAAFDAVSDDLYLGAAMETVWEVKVEREGETEMSLATFKAWMEDVNTIEDGRFGESEIERMYQQLLRSMKRHLDGDHKGLCKEWWVEPSSVRNLGDGRFPGWRSIAESLGEAAIELISVHQKWRYARAIQGEGGLYSQCKVLMDKGLHAPADKTIVFKNFEFDSKSHMEACAKEMEGIVAKCGEMGLHEMVPDEKTGGTKDEGSLKEANCKLSHLQEYFSSPDRVDYNVCWLAANRLMQMSLRAQDRNKSMELELEAVLIQQRLMIGTAQREVMEEQLDGAPTHIFYIDEKVPRSP